MASERARRGRVSSGDRQPPGQAAHNSPNLCRLPQSAGIPIGARVCRPAHFPTQTGWRLSKKAHMPSWASAARAFMLITSFA